MRKLFMALALGSLLALPSQGARAQGNDICTEYALKVALPSLQQSYMFSPAGYGPFGSAPLTYPVGVGPYGVAAFFGGPGVPFGAAPAFGPLGPGLTANLIALGVLAPRGFALFDPANAGTLISLAALQQAELATLHTRYSNSAYYQTAAATWANSYAAEAAAVFARAQAECRQRLGPPPSAQTT